MVDYRNLFNQTPVSSVAAEKTGAPVSIATAESIKRRYAELVAENERLMHVIIDLTQSLKQRENMLDNQLVQAKQQAQELQQVMNPKSNWLGRKPEPDKVRAHQLVDMLQQFMRSELKPDLFLQRDIDSLVQQTEYLERLSSILKVDAQLILSAQDELLQRIQTQSHILALQAASTRQLVEHLKQQLHDMQDWRNNFLSLLVIDIQNRL